ncbi:uncharacterized protein PRCAT00004411001 [Priceomyces carsonii]|uniref:uncharacterized protein n=1 Tax=Priceomyces carsonii TaxID=28549 RepID=UPI002ED98038|nr:unnamed protein product [Priceomyces carsonii]
MSQDTEDEDLESNTGTDEELLMHTYYTLPDKCKKYWQKRYKLFKKYDEGVYMTSELWYSVTPEAVARYTAKIVSKMLPDAKEILDVCSGGGGNSIQLAKYFDRVGVIDIQPVNVNCTMHNAAVYGVDHKLWPVVGDWNKLSKDHEDGSLNTSWIPDDIKSRSPYPFDFIFCSPPWGGPSYKHKKFPFRLTEMEPFSVYELCTSISKYAENYGLFLPRTLDLDDLRDITETISGVTGRCRVIYVNQNGFCIGMLALFGPAMTNTSDDQI